MKDRFIVVDFYLRPRLCSSPFHKIDFFVESDCHNPFAKANWYARAKATLDEDFYDAIIDLVISKDLQINRNDEIQKGIELSKKMLQLLKDEMEKNDIEFKKSSKYFVQSAFAKMSLKTIHSTVILFFQLLGTTQKKKACLTNVAFLRCSSVS